MSSRGTMSARCSFGQILSPHLLTAIFSLLSSAPSTAQTPQARHPGVWTQIGNPVEAFIPVHIALLPSSNPAQYHSKIMWWNDSHSGAGGFGGKVWKWRLGATLDDTGVRLIVYGGATGPGAVANGQVHTLDITYEWPGYDNSPKTRRIMASQAFGLTGQTMHPQGFLLFERRPEIVVPGDSTTWQVLPPRLFKEWYPFVFSMPDGHAFVAGPSILQDGTNSATYKINVNTGQWTQLPAGSGSGFKGGSAAMYTPGEILKCGSRETEYNATALGTTKVIDLNVPSPVWQSSPNMRHPRVYHNLTLLPGGDILMTGGLGIVNASANLNPVFEPELWRPPDPQYPPYPQGTWYYGPAGTLAASSLVRGYHSVALLLPDGRVLVSGGNNHADATKVDMYCPPYLFKANGQLAARPQINEVPSEIRWGQTFTVCVADTANIRAACLIRPGAVTHGFDQNQRYVPLQIAGHAGSPQRLFLTAPANSFAAPPGYYLLFLTGSADGADVASIAKWTRLDSPGGPDLCDVVPPGTITDLTPEVVGPNALWFLWTATADDALIAASGIEAYFDLRRSPVAFNSATWNTATECQNETPPWTLGTWASGGFDGLSPCTTYHFGVRAGDDAGLLSPFPGSTAFQTTCGGGGGGGGSSAHEAREERGPTTSTSESGFASSSGTEPPTSALVVETRRTATGDWQVTIRLASQADGIDPATSGIAIEREGGQGGWDILRTVTPSEDQGELGICSLRERGRVVIPDPYRLERVVPYLRHLSQDYRLNRAQHSRLGALGVEFVANGGQVDLADGDVVDLTYAPAAEPLEAASSWYLVVSRVANQSPSQFARRPSRGESFPRHFALYQNDPNPATARTVIRFDLPAESRVLLEVFDLLGRRVATLAEGTLPAGSHRAQWDLRDLSGQPVSPGVYVCRISSGEFRAHRKIGVLP